MARVYCSFSEAFEDILVRPHRLVDAIYARRPRQPIQGALVGDNVRLVRIEPRKIRLPRLYGFAISIFRQTRVTLLLKPAFLHYGTALGAVLHRHLQLDEAGAHPVGAEFRRGDFEVQVGLAARLGDWLQPAPTS